MIAAPRARRLLAAAVVVAALGAPAASAAADPATDGLWYFDALHIQEAHDAGFTGSGITIAVLDSPINPDIPTLRDADLQLGEQPDCYVDGESVPPVSTDVADAGHGTNVVSMLVGSGAEGGVKGIAPGATVLYYRVESGAAEPCSDATGDALATDSIAAGLDAAFDADADIVSLSIGFSVNPGMSDTIARGLARGVIFVVALSNQETVMDALNASSWLNGGLSVQAIGSDLAILTHQGGPSGDRIPNTDEHVDVAAPGVDILFQGTENEGWAGQTLTSGTSLATPIVAGMLAVAAEKYPEATSNQLLQALIRNTGGKDDELSYDPTMQYGYGVASLTNLLAVDPTQYPDENPLLSATGDPSLEAIAAAAAEPTNDPQPVPESPAGIPGWLVAVLIAAALAVLAVVVVVVLVLRRTRKTAP